MDDKDFVFTALWENFLKLAKVNIQTGEIRFVRTEETEERLGCLETADMESYTQSLIRNHLVYPADIPAYRYYMNTAYFRSRIARGDRTFVYSFRRRLNDYFTWITFEMIIPEGISEREQWVVCSWRYSDSETYALGDSREKLASIFLEIRKLNLTMDWYEEIRSLTEEGRLDGTDGTGISRWFRKSAKEGLVHEEDLEAYLDFTELQSLREFFRNEKKEISFRYRKRIGEGFRWVSMELRPGMEYTDENQVVMLFVRDIHDSYMEGLRQEGRFYPDFLG